MNLNDDDYKDYSRWSDFFNQFIVYFSNATIEQLILDLKAEQVSRETTENSDDNS